jgi:hypothetical protein
VVNAHHSHSESLSCAVACGYNRRNISWTVSILAPFCAGFPPGYLARISLNAKPATSKELNVISAASQICGNIIGKLLQDFFACRRDEMFLALERASALLLAPQA